MRPSTRLLRRLAAPGLLAACVLASGCATTAAPPSPPLVEEAAGVPPDAVAPTLIPVVRYGRYTLVEQAPTAAQRDLLQQVIDVTLPDTAHATVGDALRHVLLRTGFQLCSEAEGESLYPLPLPAAHLHLGPLTVRDALLTLAGPAWELQVDDVARRVCFARPGDTSPDAAEAFAHEAPQDSPPPATPLASPDGGRP